MDDLLEYVKTQQNYYKDQVDSLEKNLKELQEVDEYLKKITDDPDSINVDYLIEITRKGLNIPSQQILPNEFYSMIGYIGNYSKYPDEQQVIECTNYLKELSNNILVGLSEQIKDEDIKESKKQMESYKLFEEVINNPTKELNKEQMESIISILNETTITKEVIEFFTGVVENNTQILSTKQIEKTPQALDQKKYYLKRYKDLLEQKVLSQEQSRRIRIVLEKTLSSFEELESIPEILNIIKNDIDYLSILDNIKEMNASAFMLLIDAFDSNNKELIDEVIDRYINNHNVELSDYFEIEGMSEEYDIVNHIMEMIEEEKNNPRYDKLMNHYNNLVIPSDDEYTKNHLNQDGISLEEYQQFYNQQILYETIKKISDSRTNKEEFNKQITILKERYEEIENKDNELFKDEILDEEPISNIYDGHIENYICFFDLNQFEETRKKLNSSVQGIDNKLKNKILKLVQTDIATLLSGDYSHNIHPEKSVRNDNGVLELKGGDIRTSYYFIKGAEYNNKRVIGVLLPSYGRTSGKAKSDGLLRGLKLFGDNKEKSEYLERIFSQDASIEEQEEARRLIEEGARYCESLSAEDKKRGGNKHGNK